MDGGANIARVARDGPQGERREGASHPAAPTNREKRMKSPLRCGLFAFQEAAALLLLS